MPTYQYRCTACDDALEVVQRFSDDPLTVCPSCQGRLRKVFSPVGVVFKGSGFYKTDSRSSGKRSETAAKAADAATATTSDGAATEGSKTEASKSGSSSDGSGPSTPDAGSKSTGSSGKPADKPSKTAPKETVHKVA